jgi:hypothetical protein
MKLIVKQEWEVRKNKKIGERNLEQEVNWRRLKKFRENWRSFKMLN